MDVIATAKFFKRKMPTEENMELMAIRPMLGSGVYVFLRAHEDENPSRIRIRLTKAQAEDFAETLISAARKP